MPPKGAKKSPGEKEGNPKKKTTPVGEKKDECPPEEMAGSPKCRKEMKIPKSQGIEQDTLLDVEEVVGWALHGRLDCDYPENAKIVRIFTSSTFTGKHDDVIKWKHFPRYWPFVRGIHRSPMNSPNKDQ